LSDASWTPAFAGVTEMAEYMALLITSRMDIKAGQLPRRADD